MTKEITVEQIYQKITPLQHILLRPRTYINTVKPSKQQKWILIKDQIIFAFKEIIYTPGFYKIFDEVLVNAADNYQRNKKMFILKVLIYQERGSITLCNNGKRIPVVVHKEHKIYDPELIFGQLSQTATIMMTKEKLQVEEMSTMRSWQMSFRTYSSSNVGIQRTKEVQNDMEKEHELT